MAANIWHECDSSAIEAFLYDPDAAVLRLVFADGDEIYDYPCDPHLYVEFLAAESKGTFVNQVLKPHAERLGRSPRPGRL